MWYLVRDEFLLDLKSFKPLSVGKTAGAKLGRFAKICISWEFIVPTTLEKPTSPDLDLLDFFQEPVLLADGQGRLKAMNGPAQHLFGVDGEIHGQPIENFLNVSLGSLFREMKETLRRARVFEEDAFAKDQTGRRLLVRIRARHVRFENRYGYMIFMDHLDLEEETRRETSEVAIQVKRLAVKAGQGQTAMGVLHNISNILNSINISVQNIREITKDSKVPQLLKANELFELHRHNIQEYITTDEAGRFLPQFYKEVGELFHKDHHNLRDEIGDLQRNINLVKDLIHTQQNYANRKTAFKHFHLTRLIKDALKIELLDLKKQRVTVDERYEGLDRILGDKSRVLHVFLNLIRNAVEALIAAKTKDRRLWIRMMPTDLGRVTVFLRDNGIGMTPGQLKKIFSFGFTTKVEGHGFGLHTSLETMRELGGSLSGFSDGLERGSEFTLEFPLAEKN